MKRLLGPAALILFMSLMGVAAAEDPQTAAERRLQEVLARDPGAVRLPPSILVPGAPVMGPTVIEIVPSGSYFFQRPPVPPGSQVIILPAPPRQP